MEKKAKIILLPTESRGSKAVTIIDNKAFNTSLDPKSYNDYKSGAKHYHLYIVVDEEIKEDDWVYDSVLNQVIQLKKEGVNAIKQASSEFGDIGYKKIIATTDSSLTIPCTFCKGEGDVNTNLGNIGCFKCNEKGETQLPQPSSSFIAKFVELYNKGKAPEYLMIEYESCPITVEELMERSGNVNGLLPSKYFLKVNPKDNCIIIKPIKSEFTRKEVVELFNKCEKDGIIELKKFSHEFNKWIEENLI